MKKLISVLIAALLLGCNNPSGPSGDVPTLEVQGYAGNGPERWDDVYILDIFNPFDPENDMGTLYYVFVGLGPIDGVAEEWECIGSAKFVTHEIGWTTLSLSGPWIQPEINPNDCYYFRVDAHTTDGTGWPCDFLGSSEEIMAYPLIVGNP